MKKLLSVILLSLVILTGCEEEENNLPEIVEINYSPLKPKSGDIVTLNCIALDADGDQLIYAWNVSVGELVENSKKIIYYCVKSHYHDWNYNRHGPFFNVYSICKRF